jgi:hypothetical protein
MTIALIMRMRICKLERATVPVCLAFESIIVSPHAS